MVAAPQPPSLKLPQPVTDLTAQRTGEQVDLHWTMPSRATDNVPLVGPQTVRICRRAESQLCTYAGSLSLRPQGSGSFTDHLPAALTSGPSRPLLYSIELQNQHGRSAGPSNTAIASAGSAPPPIAGLRAQAQADGIVLSWTPQPGSETVRIHRVLVVDRTQNKTQNNTSPQKSSLPSEQTLEFSGEDQGRVLDSNAVLDHTYTYTVQRIATVTVQGHQVEMDSAPSPAITINARDVFPPAVPNGLEAVADQQSHAIDLSWQPDNEADLAGYTVYRREAGSSGSPARISPPAQPSPSFRDTNVLPGHTYQYSVSAVDRDGNESPRSPEVEETLPQP